MPDGSTLKLEDGREIRLAGIEAPTAPMGAPAGSEWPFARAAREALSSLLKGRTVTLRGDSRPDRYGRLVAQVWREDGVWAESALLDAGRVRVCTTLATRALARAMLRHEAAARDIRLGIWRSPAFAVERPDGLEHASGRFVLVEGVLDAAEKRRSLMVLPLRDSTFSLRADHAARRLFEDVGMPLGGLAGHRVRVRGWVEWQGRPFIELTHPEQVELVGAATGDAAAPAE